MLDHQAQDSECKIPVCLCSLCVSLMLSFCHVPWTRACSELKHMLTCQYTAKPQMGRIPNSRVSWPLHTQGQFRIIDDNFVNAPYYAIQTTRHFWALSHFQHCNRSLLFDCGTRSNRNHFQITVCFSPAELKSCCSLRIDAEVHPGHSLSQNNCFKVPAQRVHFPQLRIFRQRMTYSIGLGWKSVIYSWTVS